MSAHNPEKDYNQVYEEFWKDIIEDENGNLNKDQVKRELADFYFIMNEVPKVYMEVTGGMISKPNTFAFEVIGEAENRIQESFKDWLKDECEVCEYKRKIKKKNKNKIS